MSNSYIGFVILIVLPAMLSMIVRRIVSKQKVEIRCIITYICMYYCGFSVLKCILGEGNITIFDSFQDNVPRTYFHFFIPLLISIIIIPTIQIKKKEIFIYIFPKYEGLFVASFASSFIPIYMLRGTYLNHDVLVWQAIFVVFLIMSKLNFRLMEYDNIYDLRYTICIVAFWCVTVILYIPNQLYLTNIEEFPFPFTTLLLYLLAGAILITCLFCVLISFMPTLYRRIFISVFFGFSIAGYMQANFLNGKLINLDGSIQQWSGVTKTINLFVWIVILLLCLFLALKYKTKAIKAFSCIGGLFICTQIMALIFLLINADFSKKEYILTNENIFELNENKNVIVFILDWYDEQIIERIKEEDQNFLTPLDGFTWYKNQTSLYDFTAGSLPYLLTNVEWHEGITREDYPRYAMQNSSFLQEIHNMGYDIDIYTDPRYVGDNDNLSIIDNYTTSENRKMDFGSTLSMMQKCAKYQTSMFVLKDIYRYETHEITYFIVDNRFYSGQNYRFYNLLLENGISVSKKGNGSYRFYHIDGTHDLVFDENCDKVDQDSIDVISCGKGTMKIIFEYIKQLKENDIYDSSVIIITADHGQNVAYKRGLNNTSNPILFVKDANEHGQLRTSLAPVSHTEFCSSVISYMGADGSKYGRNYEDIGVNEERCRIMVHFSDDGDLGTKYVINGLATDVKNWNYEYGHYGEE